MNQPRPCSQCGKALRPKLRRFCSKACTSRFFAAARTTPTQERFQRHFDRGTPDECWLWKGGIDSWGYGIFDARAQKRAHRYALAQKLGRPLLKRELALHRCDTPACVNPSHLFVGTQRDNMRDMAAKGRSYWQIQTHCKNGHAFDEANTYLEFRRGRQTRVCRACNREAQARARRVASEVMP